MSDEKLKWCEDCEFFGADGFMCGREKDDPSVVIDEVTE